MSEQTPVPEQTSAPEDPAGRRSTRRLVIAGAAVAVLLACAGGAFAVVRKLDGGGAQPHDVLPGSVVAYARLDLDPSAGQKIALLRLIRKFPDAARSIGVKSPKQDVRKLLFDEAIRESGCDLDYGDDIEPWLGSRFAVALEKDGKTPLVALQVTDEGKAKKGIAAIGACGDEDAPGVAFTDGYAVIAEKQSIAERAVKDAAAHPLADDKAFIEDFDDLGDQGIASVWADTKALNAFGTPITVGSSPFQGLRSTALTLRARPTAVELSGIAHVDDKLGTLTRNKLTTLPDSTALAFSFAGGGSARVRASFDDFLKQVQADDQEAEQELASFEREYGIRLPEDLETLSADSLTFAAGSRNLERLPALGSSGDPLADLDLGLAFGSDPAKAKDLADRLVSLVQRLAGLRLAASASDDGAVIATNSRAAEAMSGGGDLGKTERFSRVVPDADTAFGAFYVDIQAILDALGKSNPPPDVADVIDQLGPLSAVGGSVGKQSEHVAQGTLRLTFDK